MRIALLCPLPPERTGIAEYAQHLREGLDAAGAEVSTPLPGGAVRTPADARAWVASMDWSRVDVVHAELGGGRAGEFLALQALAAWRRTRPAAATPALSATVHDPERLVWRPVTGPVGWLQRRSGWPRAVKQAAALLGDPLTLAGERRLAAALDGLTCLTRTGATCLAQRMGLPDGRVGHIPHGVLRLPPAELPPLPPQEPLRLLYFGFIYRGKGIEDLIDALAQTPGGPLAATLTIAGGAAPEIAFGSGGDYVGELRQRIAQRGLQARVHWRLDVPGPDVARLIQSHHVMVLPYQEPRRLALLGQMRGTSGALAWALACGRGVVTSDARAFAEEIESGNGLAYPQGEVAALADRLRSLTADPMQAVHWAARAAALARQRAWPHTAERFIARFDALCRARRGLPQAGATGREAA